MSTLQITPTTLVDEVLRALPDTAPIFIKYHTDCVGCRMTRFCTLSEVAKTYQINLQSLLDDLEKIAKSSDSERSSSEALP
jgi:hybrid cluster-associated redox disulfide protein